METWKMAQDIEKQTTFENEKKEIDEREIYRQALEKWGSQAQIFMLFEEMAELQNAICKAMRGRTSFLAVAEEIADVEIMLEQMKILFNIDEAVLKYRKYKTDRLVERLGGRLND